MEESLSLKQKIEAAREFLAEKLEGRAPEVGVVLGSGLGPLAEGIQDAICIPFADVPYMKTSTTTSHVGRFVCGILGGTCVLAMQGRLHGYEGNSSQEVAFPIWVMGAVGVKVLIVTNAAGAINASYNVGDFCLMIDHINFTGRNPVVGVEPDKVAFRFFSMYEAYDPALRDVARQVAAREEVPLREGVYLGLLGPSFETPAEIRAFRSWGADTVAMSVCEEVIAARHIGMRVLGISLISNMACGVEGSSPDDMEVLETAHDREDAFCRLITGVVERIGL